MRPEPVVQVYKIINILNNITNIQKELAELNKNMEGINSTSFTALGGYKTWNDAINFSDNFIEFKENK